MATFIITSGSLYAISGNLIMDPNTDFLPWESGQNTLGSLNLPYSGVHTNSLFINGQEITNITGENLGSGVGLFASTSGSTLQFYSISGINGINVYTLDNTVLISGNSQQISGSYVTGAVSSGTGFAIFNSENNSTLIFNTISGIGNVTVTSTNGLLTISVPSMSGSFFSAPSSTINDAIVLWSGIVGGGFLNSNVLITNNGSALNAPIISGTTISGNAIFASGIQIMPGNYQPTGNYVISGSSTILDILDVAVLSGTTISGNFGSFNTINVNTINAVTENIITINDYVFSGNSISGNNIYASGAVYSPIISGTTISGNAIYENGLQVINSGIGLGNITITQSNSTLTISGTQYVLPSTLSNLIQVDSVVLSGTTISGNNIYENGILVATKTDVSNVSGVAATSIQNATNLGTGIDLFSSKSGTNLQFNTVSGVGTITASLVGNVIQISSTAEPSGNYIVSGSSTILNILDVTVLSGTTISGNSIYSNGVLLTNYTLPSSLTSLTLVDSSVLSGTTISGNAFYLNGVPLINYVLPTSITGETLVASSVLSGTTISGNSIYLNGVALTGNYVLPTSLTGLTLIDSSVISGTTISGNNIYLNGIALTGNYTLPTSITGETLIASTVLSGTTISGNNIYLNGIALTGNYTLPTSLTGLTLVDSSVISGTTISGNNIYLNGIALTGNYTLPTTITGETLVASTVLSGTTISGNLITALTELYSPIISGTTINSNLHNSSVISGTTISGNAFYLNGVALINYVLPTSITGEILVASTVISGTTISGNSIYSNGTLLSNYSLPTSITGETLVASVVLSGTTISGNNIYSNGVLLTNYSLPTTITGETLIASATISGTTISGNAIYEYGNEVIALVSGLGTISIISNSGGVVVISGSASSSVISSPLNVSVVSGTTISGNSIYLNGVALTGNYILPTSLTGLTLVDSMVLSGTTISGNNIFLPLSGSLWQGMTPSNYYSGMIYVANYSNIVMQEGYLNIFGTQGPNSTNADATIDMENRGSGTFNYSELALDRSRGAFSQVSGVLTGDDLGHVGWWGSADVSGDYINGAYIRGLALENYNFSGGNGGTKIQFSAQNTGAGGSLIPIMELNANGGAGFLGTTSIPLGNIYSNNLISTSITTTNVYGTAGLGATLYLISQGGPVVISGTAVDISAAGVPSYFNITDLGTTSTVSFSAPTIYGSVISGTTISGNSIYSNGTLLVNGVTQLNGEAGSITLQGLGNITIGTPGPNTINISGTQYTLPSSITGLTLIDSQTISGTTISGNNIYLNGVALTGNYALPTSITGETLIASTVLSGTTISGNAFYLNGVALTNYTLPTSITGETLVASVVLSGSTISGNLITALTELYSPLISGTTINSNLHNSSIISGTTISGNLITALTELYSPLISGTTISGNNITAGIELFAPLISGTIISGNTNYVQINSEYTVRSSGLNPITSGNATVQIVNVANRPTLATKELNLNLKKFGSALFNTNFYYSGPDNGGTLQTWGCPSNQNGTITSNLVEPYGFGNNLSISGLAAAYQSMALSVIIIGASGNATTNYENSGFFYNAQIATSDTSASYASGTSFWVGAIAAGLSPSGINPGANSVGFQYHTGRGDTTWVFQTTNNASTQTTISGASAMPFTVGCLYNFYIYAPPLATTVYGQVDNLTSGTTWSTSIATNLPTGNASLRPAAGLTNLSPGIALRQFRLNRIYVETPNA